MIGYELIGVAALALGLTWQLADSALRDRRRLRLTAITDYLRDMPNGATAARIAQDLGKTLDDPRIRARLDTLAERHYITRDPLGRYRLTDRTTTKGTST